MHDRGDGGYQLTYRRFQKLYGQHFRVLSHSDPIDPIDSKSTTVIYINIDSVSLPFFSLSFFLGLEGTEAELIELIVQQF